MKKYKGNVEKGTQKNALDVDVGREGKECGKYITLFSKILYNVNI